jgi:hypothetical protein
LSHWNNDIQQRNRLSKSTSDYSDQTVSGIHWASRLSARDKAGANGSRNYAAAFEETPSK